MEYRVTELAGMGICPDGTSDYTAKIGEAFSEDAENVVYRFGGGAYSFHASSGVKCEYSQSNTDVTQSEKTVSFLIKNRRNIVIDGNGSEFIFHGHLQPFTLDGCENITLRNFTIDWEKPIVSECRVIGKSCDYLDVFIDQQLFPCRVMNYSLYFDIGDGELSELTYGDHTVYEPETMTVAEGSSNVLRIKSVEQLSSDTFRLYNNEKLRRDRHPKLGDVIVLRHNKHIHAGIFAENCRNIVCENIVIHSAGEGFLFQFCENVTCRNVKILPNRRAGRLISCSRDYGIQISACAGEAVIEECSFHGLQDDPVNIHGIGVCLKKITGEKSLDGEFARSGICNFRHWAKKGQTLRFIDRRSMKYLGNAVVSSFTLVDMANFRIETEEPIPAAVHSVPSGAVAIENYSCSPEVVIRNNRFGSGRARGAVVMTPRRVLIEGNVFESAGAAIVIAGDALLWFAVGASDGVTVRKNTFTDACRLSEYQYGNAVISICPEIQKPIKKHCYHRNIKIEDNVFMTSDVPVLYAYSTENLRFAGNRIFRSGRRAENAGTEWLIRTDSCENADVGDNIINGDFPFPVLSSENCTFADPDIER